MHWGAVGLPRMREGRDRGLVASRGIRSFAPISGCSRCPDCVYAVLKICYAKAS